jgi:type IV secretion system protein VirB1
VARVESGRDPLVIGVNGPTPQRFTADSPAGAAALAERLIAAGRNIDLGLAQINVRNLAPLGLSVADAFDPCRNLRASAAVLRAGWARTAAQSDPASAMSATLSLYNTGTTSRGRLNGYVAKVVAAAGPSGAAPAPGPMDLPSPPAWRVFAGARRADRFVLAPTSGAVE